MMKPSRRIIFQKRNSCYAISRYKIHNKVTSRSVKSIFCAYEVKNDVFSEGCIKLK